MKGTTLLQWPWRCMAHLSVIWIVSLGSVPVFSTIDNWEVIYPCLVCIKFFKQRVNIVFKHDLASAIKRKIVLVGDIYSKPPNTIRSHDLQISDIRRAVGGIISYHKKDFFPFFGFLHVMHFLAFHWLFIFHHKRSGHDLTIIVVWNLLFIGSYQINTNVIHLFVLFKHWYRAHCLNTNVICLFVSFKHICCMFIRVVYTRKSYTILMFK
jgi:hypothetical protein